MPTAAGGIYIDPNGSSAVVQVTTPTGVAIPMFSDVNCANPVVMPATITVRTAFYSQNPEPAASVSVKVGGTEYASPGNKVFQTSFQFGAMDGITLPDPSVLISAPTGTFVQAISVSSLATGGLGTKASPYTGWEAPLTAKLAATPRATVIFDALCLQSTAVNLPGSGTFKFTAPSLGLIYDYNNGGSPPGIITTADIGGQPGGISTQAAKATYLFVANTNGTNSGLNVDFSDLMVYGLASTTTKPQAILYRGNGSVYSLRFEHCDMNFMGFYTNDGGAPMSQMNACWIVRNQFADAWIYDLSPPQEGEISGNIGFLAGIQQGGTNLRNPLPNSQFLQCSNFWSWWIHHNFFSYQGVGTVAGAVIYFGSVNQSQNGSIHDNTFYGCSDAAIYVSSGNGAAGVEAGLTIHDNQFDDWNHDNVAGALGAAVYIDSPLAYADIRIGPNQYHAGTNSKYQIVCVPDINASGFEVEIDPAQVLVGTVTTAAVRVNGVNYTSAEEMLGRLRPRTIAQATLDDSLVAQTVSIDQITASYPPASGYIYLHGVMLLKGQVVSSVRFLSGSTALATGTHQWFSVWRWDGTNYVNVAVTADDTSTAWAANAVKSLALTAAYTVPKTGIYYFGHCIVATTTPTIAEKADFSSTLAGASSNAKHLVALSTSAGTYTTPASCPASMAPGTVLSQNHLAWAAAA